MYFRVHLALVFIFLLPVGEFRAWAYIHPWKAIIFTIEKPLYSPLNSQTACILTHSPICPHLCPRPPLPLIGLFTPWSSTLLASWRPHGSRHLFTPSTSSTPILPCPLQYCDPAPVWSPLKAMAHSPSARDRAYNFLASTLDKFSLPWPVLLLHSLFGLAAL